MGELGQQKARRSGLLRESEEPSSQFERPFRLLNPSPARPMPSNARVAGSGTPVVPLLLRSRRLIAKSCPSPPVALVIWNSTRSMSAVPRETPRKIAELSALLVELPARL